MVTNFLGISSIGASAAKVFESMLPLIGCDSISLLALTTRDLNTLVQVTIFRVDPKKLPNLLLVLFS